MDCGVEKMSVSDYLRYKQEMFFKYLDIGKDGILSKEEHMSFLKNLRQAGKLDVADNLQIQLDECWNRMTGVTNLPNNAEGFTLAQWLLASSIVYPTEWFRVEFLPVVAHIYFESMDRNHDGWISVQEWRLFHSERGVTDEAFVQATFDQMDQDGNGKITGEEVEHAILQFHLGEDPAEDFSFLYKIH